MARGYTFLLLVVAAVWGSSYMFIKVAVEEIAPSAMMFLRLVLASAALVPAVAVVAGGLRPAAAQIRATGRAAFGVGFLNMALPFFLIAWGEQYVDSGIAAIANASVPIFVALLALRFNPSERVRGLRLVGVVLGLGGVAVLTGLHPEGGWWVVAGTLAIVVASLSYGAANLFVQQRFAETPPLVTACVSALTGGLILLPLAVWQIPADVPSWKALGSVAALGLLGTAFALIFFYRLIAAYGSSRAALVTYLLPPFALFYGTTILDEPITMNAVLGLVLILGGVALGSGFVRAGRRREAAPASPRP